MEITPLGGSWHFQKAFVGYTAVLLCHAAPHVQAKPFYVFEEQTEQTARACGQWQSQQSLLVGHEVYSCTLTMVVFEHWNTLSHCLIFCGLWPPCTLRTEQGLAFSFKPTVFKRCQGHSIMTHVFDSVLFHWCDWYLQNHCLAYLHECQTAIARVRNVSAQK